MPSSFSRLFVPKSVATAMIALAMAFALHNSVEAQTPQYWDVNGSLTGTGGTGTWDTTTPFWNDFNGTGTPTTWTNGNRAIFSGVAGVVTLGTPITASGVEFTDTGFTISGTNALTVTSTGTTTTAALRQRAGTNTISAPIILGAAANTTQTVSTLANTTLNISGDISSTNTNVTFRKESSGTLTLTGNNTYTGPTLIAFTGGSGGTINVSGVGTNQALGGTSGITVSTGGTLNQTTSNQINDSATMTLGGGALTAPTYRLNTGVSEGTTATAGLGALTLTSSSVIDLAGINNILHFADSSDQSWTSGTTLSIYNYNGTPFEGGGAEQLLFGSNNTALTQAQLNSISFYSDNGTTFLGTGGFTPLNNGEVAPVPEPSTWIGGALALAAIGFTQRRRFRSLLAHRA